MKFGCFLLSVLLTGIVAAEELSSAAFLARARRPNPQSTCISVLGGAEHRRRGGSTENAPLYFSLILQPERMTGQILIGEKEGYLLGQARDGGSAASSVVPMPGSVAADGGMLRRMGIDPSDLALNFLFFDFLRELPSETVRLVPCRVLELSSPDRKERVRVWIARDQYFPLRTEFYKAAKPDAPYRTLEIEAFAQENQLYYASEAGIHGPGWRTRIRFAKPLLIGSYTPQAAPKLFRKIGEVK